MSTVVQCVEKIDDSVGHRNPYITAIVQRQVSAIRRRSKAGKRDHTGVASLNVLAPSGDGRSTDLISTLCVNDGDRRVYRDRRLTPGQLGLFLAALLAGVMSSCDSFMISSAALFTENIYRPLRMEVSNRHCIWVGRLASVVFVAGRVAFAFWVPSVVKALEIWFMIAPMMGLVFWIGLFWRRMTVAGAWATSLTGFAAWWVSTQPWFIQWLQGIPAAESLRLLWTEGETPVVYLPWQILFYSSIASVVGVAVSLVTPAVDPIKLKRFYQLSRTPVQAGEKVLQPCTLPRETPPIDRRMLLTAGGLEIPVPSRTSVIGFAIAWLLVGAIIGAYVWTVS